MRRRAKTKQAVNEPARLREDGDEEDVSCNHKAPRNQESADTSAEAQSVFFTRRDIPKVDTDALSKKRRERRGEDETVVFVLLSV